MIFPSHSINNYAPPTTDTVYGDKMSLGTNLNGDDGKTPIWKMLDRAAWKEQTYYTLQRCPTITHTHTPITHSHKLIDNPLSVCLPATTCACASCTTFYFTLLRSLLSFISLNCNILRRFTLTPSAQKNELGQPSSWTHARRQLSQKNIDFTSVNPKVSAQKVRKTHHHIT